MWVDAGSCGDGGFGGGGGGQRLVDNFPCQDENADYVAGDGDIAQDGGDADTGPKEAVPVAEVRSQW